jgi:ABC-2 type transport system permease protein
MMARLSRFFSRQTLWNLTGPIFDKELRTSSRRVRNYWLRVGYLAAMTAFLALVWASVAADFQRGGSLAVQIANMSMAGMIIITAIVVFQFLATQFLAVILMSTAISDEIYHSTLGVLMTTPINSFQIVIGKLFSNLLQIVILIGISLPLLSLVRVFGGVPWSFVWSSLCVTLTAIVFAGSLSLYFSISGRRSYAVILKTILALGVLYGFVPGLIVWMLYYKVSLNHLLPWVILPNPLLTMYCHAITVVAPNATAGFPFYFAWWPNCLILLAFSLVILARSIAIVRVVALRQATGQSTELFPELPFVRSLFGKKPSSEGTAAEDQIREVRGAPVVWKELRAPLIQGGRKAAIAGLIVSIGALAFTYAMGYKDNLLREDNTHMSYLTIFMFMGLVANLVLPATTITAERETRCWPLLLATILDDWQILLGKAAGVIRRCLPMWLFITAHTCLFIVTGYIHPIALLHLAMIAIGASVFVTGSGLYFSAVLRRTTSAVVANLALAIGLWAVMPVVMLFVTIITTDRDYLNWSLKLNPIAQTSVIAKADSGEDNAIDPLSDLRYQWTQTHRTRFGRTTLTLLGSMIGYSLAGAAFAWRAQRRLRRHVFD